MIFDSYKEETNKPLFRFSGEKNNYFKLNNSKRLSIRQYDIRNYNSGKHKTCDYILDIVTEGAYFIEIKGKKIEEAIEQLESTIQLVKNELIPKKAFIIPTRNPYGTDTQNFKIKFHQKNNALLIITSHCNETV